MITIVIDGPHKVGKTRIAHAIAGLTKETVHVTESGLNDNSAETYEIEPVEETPDA